MKISLFIFEKSLTIFDWNFEVWAVQKYANLVDRVKSFPTSIYLQKSASIQPRTSLSKFEVIYSLLFIRLHIKDTIEKNELLGVNEYFRTRREPLRDLSLS